MSQAVTVYSTTWCGFCKQAKKYFDSIGVEYKEVNVEEDKVAAEKMVEESGQMGVPVIKIGTGIVVGFDKPKIDTLLKSNKRNNFFDNNR